MIWLATLVFASLFANCGGVMATTAESAAEAGTKVAYTAVQQGQTERFEQIYSLNPNGKVKASNINGSITVKTWENPQVNLIAVKSADTAERLKDVQIEVDSTADGFSVKAKYINKERNQKGNWKGYGEIKVDFELTVPRTAALAGIATVNGNVSIAGAGGTTKASTVNGTVKATNLSGTAKLSTVNGTVEAAFSELPSGSKISLNTVNGKVALFLPSDANATIKASSLSGAIANDFGLPVRKGEFIGRNLHGKVGTGDVSIRLNSVSGGLSIRRNNDGKSVSPATNLLKMKKDRDDEDDIM